MFAIKQKCDLQQNFQFEENMGKEFCSSKISFFHYFTSFLITEDDHLFSFYTIYSYNYSFHTGLP